MPDAKSRARVQRLLRDDFRPDDLTGLFLYARDRCDGREAVADIGHFVAHHNERDRGIITRSTREWFAVARFHMARFSPEGPRQFDSGRMPPATRDYFRLAMGRIPPKTFKVRTGLRKTEALRRLSKIADELKLNPDGTWALPSAVAREEIDLIKCAIGLMVVKPAFEDSQLFDGFVETLKSNGLITKEELREHSGRLRTLVSLFAVAAMHNSVVQIGDGTTVQLQAAPNTYQNSISVNAPVPLSPPHGNYREEMFFTAAIFEANLSPNEHCHPDLVSVYQWDMELEVDRNGKLAALC